MLRVFIIEDEAPARERLATLLAATEPPCRVIGTADSLAAATRFLAEHAAPDLIFADIELGDGLSLELFRSAPPPCPVVFTTAHDDYVLEAFATNGIAYLLKPVKPAALATALKKYRDLGQHYAAQLSALATSLLPAPAPATALPVNVRQRILAQRGRAFQPVALGEIAYFFSENKLTFLLTRTGERCLVNEPLGTLEQELNPSDFFRVNRNYLVHSSAVKSFSSVGKGRLAVQLAPRTSEEIVVSQETAAAFRAWVGR